MEFFYSKMDQGILILNADGELNSDTAKEFIDELVSLIDSGETKIVVDCTHLDHISSYGLGVLVRLHSKLKKKGGDVKLASVKGVVEQVFKITQLNKIFEIYPDVSQACLMFRPKDV